MCRHAVSLMCSHDLASWNDVWSQWELRVRPAAGYELRGWQGVLVAVWMGSLVIALLLM